MSLEHGLTLKTIHRTSFRTRFAYEYTKGCKISPIPLRVAVETIEGVKNVRVNAILHNIIIEHDEHIHRLEEQVYTALKELLAPSVHDISSESYIALRDEIPNSYEVVRSATSLVAEPFIHSPTINLVFASVACLPIITSGIKELFKEGITSRVLEAMAIAISLHRKDFRTANSANFMLSLGEYIEEMTMYKSNDLIKELSKPQVKETWIEQIIDGKKERRLVDTHTLKIGDIVIVNAGNTICVDGHIVSGEGLVNQISMTGEATPIRKTRGDKVLSGTIVEEGEIKIWAESVGDSTATAKIKNYIEETLVQKSSIQLSASKMADGLVPVTLGLAVFSYLYSKDLTRAASVLQADYSCALKLATPVAFKAAISSAGKNGIIIKGAKSIEALYESNVFVFDKTGTLTKGELEVIDVHSFSDKWKSDDILNLSASIEEHYFHPVAEAVVQAAKKRDFVHIHHEEVTFIVAHGVKSEIEGKTVVIGSQHFLEEDEHIDFQAHKEAIQEFKSSGNTPLFIGYDKKLIGVIMLKDTIRPNAKEVLRQLKQSGVKEIVMLTGDTKEKANEIAQELCIDRCYAELLPTKKAEILEQIMREGQKVAFVGDGINDAPALIKADAGIGMHKGADIAKASADIVLLRDDIQAVADAKEFANACLSRVNTNFKATVGINSAILGLATLGKLSPIQTAFLHNGTTILLLLNALRSFSLSKKRF